MLGTRQRPGVLLAYVPDAHFNGMQAILNAAVGRFDANELVKNMLAQASSNSRRYVNLVEEGWHQFERLYGKNWKHITLFYRGVKFHCYCEVATVYEIPAAATHRIFSISYVAWNNNRSRIIEVFGT